MNKHSIEIKKLLKTCNIDMGTFGLIELELKELENLQQLIINKITELTNKHESLSAILPINNNLHNLQSLPNNNLLKLFENIISISSSLDKKYYKE